MRRPAAAALLAFAAHTAVAASAPEPIVVFGAAAGAPAQTLPALGRLQALGADPAGLEGRVRVVPLKEKRPMAQGWPMQVSSPAAPTPGWRVTADLVSHSRTGPQAATVLEMPMAPRSVPGAIPFRLGDYQELWLDYAAVRGFPRCDPSLRLELLLGDPKLRRLAWAGATPLAPQVVLDTAADGWVRKGPGYLLGRWLGSAPGKAWHYSQDGGRALVQRRLDQGLHGMEHLELTLKPGVQVQHVNLRVRRRGGSEEILQFPELLSRAVAGKDAATLRLPLRETLEQREPGHGARDLVDGRTDAFRLVEISIFIPGDAERVASEGALRGAALLAPAQAGDAATFRLPTRTVSDAFGRHRLVVDLRALARAGEVALGNAAVRVAAEASQDARACSVVLGGVRAANPYPGEVPLFASRLESIANEWSGAAWEPAADAGSVHVPGILARFDFAMLAAGGEPAPASRYLLELRDPGKPRLESLPPAATAVFARRVDGTPLARADMISPDAGRLRVSGAAPRAIPTGKGLGLEGASEMLQFEWSWNGRIGPRTLFLLAAGTQEALGEAELELDTTQGPRRQRVVANEPLAISDRDVEVRAVRLRIRPHRAPFRLDLHEMVLFEPALATLADAFESSVMLHRRIAAVPVGKQPAWLLEAAPGRLAGVLPGDDTSAASFEADPVLEHARGLRLAYRMPATLGPCPLAVRLTGATGAVERRLCLPGPEGEAYVPIATLLEKPEDGRAIAGLRMIDLRLVVDDAPLRRRVDSFRLDFELDGWTRLSPAEESLERPVFAISDEKAGSNLATLREAVARGSAWRALETHEVARLLGPGGRIEAAGHPLFTIDRVELLPRQGHDGAKFRGERPGGAPAPSSRGRYLALGALVAALVLGWWLGGIDLASRWLAPRSAALVAGVRDARSRVLDYGLRWLPGTLGVAGGVAAIVALWAAGRWADGATAFVLLVFSAFLAVGAWMHLRPARAAPWRPHLLRVMLAAAAGIVVWNAGRTGLAGFSWGILPLLAWIYAWLPSRSPRLRFFAERGLQIALWAMLAIAALIAARLFFPGQGGSLPAVMAAFFAAAALATVVRSGFDLAEALPERYRAALYRGPGASFFGAAGLALVLAAAMLVARMEALAEQFSIVAYCAAVLGILAQIGRGRRQRPAAP
jgi:hypothetical protein